MSAMTIPLIGVYNYDNTILNGLHVPTEAELPTGIEYISPIPALSDDTLRMQLLFELGELSPVHSDPEILKKMVEIWNAVNHPTWVQLWQTTLYKYNPIWNKDGSWRESRAFQLAGSTTGSVDFDETKTGRDTSTGSNSSNVTHSVTGYDTNSLSTASGDNGTGSTSETVNTSLTTGADTSTRGSETRSENETIEHTEQGNIGVTTTQAMIKEQREIVTFNMYRFIIDSFKKQFMITVWEL